MKNIFRFLFVVFCLFTTTNPLHAQWIQTNGPYGGYVFTFAVSGTNLFAGTWGGGVFLSTNNGTSWTDKRTDKILFRQFLTSQIIYTFAFESGDQKPL